MIKHYAKIVNGVVIDVSDADDVWPFGDDPRIEITDGFGVDDLYDGASFSKSASKSLQQETPKSVTMRQARLALLNIGKLGTVDSAIASMTGIYGDAARIEWEFSSEVHRNRPLVLALAPILNMTDAQLDQLFVEASKL